MTLPSDWKVLLACAKSNPSDEELRLSAKAARADVNWNEVAAASYAHGIAPLVFHNLRRSGAADLLPAAVTEALRNAYYLNAARNALLYDELRTVLVAFRKKFIDVIALKGAALAETVYDHRALRPMSDIDLLVRKERLADVENILGNMGYALGEHSETKEWLQEHHYHLVFTKRSAVNIEVHWHMKRPQNGFSIDIDGLWKRAQPITVGDVEALQLSPEDLLLHLCQHMHNHNLIGGIRPLCDIAHVVKHYNNALDWTEFRNRAFEWRVAPYVYLVLHLAKELLDARIQSSFLNGLEPAGFDRAVILLAKERLLDCESSSISHNLVQLCWSGRRFRDRLAALGNAFASDIVAQSYSLPQHSTRILYYYPERIIYLITRYGPLLWQLVSGDQKTRGALEKGDRQLRLTNWLSSDQ
jgi:hypothetical protein